jgi:antitoxin FitA
VTTFLWDITYLCWNLTNFSRNPVRPIRDVPEEVRDELAARAALQGKSMQEFLRTELERLAARPSIDAWLLQVRKRKHAAQTHISSKQILENRNADRR